MAWTLRTLYTVIEKSQRKNLKTAMVKAKKVECQSSSAAPSGLQPRTWKPTARRMFRIGTGVRYASGLAEKKIPTNDRQGKSE